MSDKIKTAAIAALLDYLTAAALGLLLTWGLVEYLTV